MKSGAQTLPGLAVTLAAALAALLPMLGVAHTLFGNSLAAYLPLYPLALLPLFRKPAAAFNSRAVAAFVPGILLTGCGIAFGRLSLVWIGAFWNFLAVSSFSGVVFAFPAPLLVFAAPPLSAFTSVAAGFSLRLWLTDVSARILTFLDPAAHAEGNVIFFQGGVFTVDRVCEGMKMAVAAFLIAAVLGRFSAPKGRLIIALLVAPLWLAANFLRILSLVAFRIPAESSAHEIVGLVFFVTVLLFPLLLAALAFPGKEKASAVTTENSTVQKSAVFVVCAVLAILFFAVPRTVETRHWPRTLAGFKLDADSPRSDPRIAIYTGTDASVILKREPFAPATAHDPRICFEAAGFTFGQEKEERVGDFVLRSAAVEKAGKRARLFWWYAWDNVRSSSDIEWRIARTSGKDVTQWNLYGQDNAELRRTALQFLKMNPPDSVVSR